MSVLRRLSSVLRSPSSASPSAKTAGRLPFSSTSAVNLRIRPQGVIDRAEAQRRRHEPILRFLEPTVEPGDRLAPEAETRHGGRRRGAPGTCRRGVQCGLPHALTRRAVAETGQQQRLEFHEGPVAGRFREPAFDRRQRTPPFDLGRGGFAVGGECVADVEAGWAGYPVGRTGSRAAPPGSLGRPDHIPARPCKPRRQKRPTCPRLASAVESAGCNRLPHPDPHATPR